MIFTCFYPRVVYVVNGVSKLSIPYPIISNKPKLEQLKNHSVASIPKQTCLRRYRFIHMFNEFICSSIFFFRVSRDYLSFYSVISVRFLWAILLHCTRQPAFVRCWRTSSHAVSWMTIHTTTLSNENMRRCLLHVLKTMKEPFVRADF